MDWNRIINTIHMYTILSPVKRAQFLKKKHIFRSVGNNCMVMFRKIPLYGKLISLGNNVWIASQVSFVTHDVIHYMLNSCIKDAHLKENLGCIRICDNVFIGANSTILSNVSIGPNTIIGAGSLVNKSVGEGVYAGVPARYICSIDEFVEKRKKNQLDEVSYSHGGLSKKTIDKLWDEFERSQKGNA